MNIIFDLDNTLYPFAGTGFQEAFLRRIEDVFMECLNISSAEALKLAMTYHRQYGLSVVGLHLHHPDVAPDVEALCERVNQGPYEHLSMTLGPPSHSQLTGPPTGLEGLWWLRRKGHRLAVLTNSSRTHAERCLCGLGLASLFERESVVDCVQQWRLTEKMDWAEGEKAASETNPKQVLCNKPSPKAYHAVAQYLSFFGGAEPRKFAMVDDAVVNLEAPAAMNWITVWVAYGQSLPPVPFQPTAIVEDIEEALTFLLSLPTN